MRKVLYQFCRILVFIFSLLLVRHTFIDLAEVTHVLAKIGDNLCFVQKAGKLFTIVLLLFYSIDTPSSAFLPYVTLFFYQFPYSNKIPTTNVCMFDDSFSPHRTALPVPEYMDFLGNFKTLGAFRPLAWPFFHAARSEHRQKATCFCPRWSWAMTENSVLQTTCFLCSICEL